VNASELESPGHVSRLQLVDLHGDLLTEVAFTAADHSNTLYNSSAFLPPDKFFYVKVFRLRSLHSGLSSLFCLFFYRTKYGIFIPVSSVFVREGFVRATTDVRSRRTELN